MSSASSAPTTEQLLAIIRTQTEIARLGADLNGVMSIVAEQAAVITHAKGGVVELGDGDDMVYRATSGAANAQLGLRIPKVGSLSGLAAEMASMLVCTDSETDPRVDRVACRRVGLRSMVVVPLTHGGTAVGVLKVFSPSVNAFSRGDLHTLQLMADVVSAAMFHASKYGTDEVFRQATTDALTGLPNRALFLDRLRHSVAKARRDKRALTVLTIGLDGLRAINDTHGQRGGDAVLVEAGRRFAAVARASDTFARMGGDEFAAVLTSTERREDAQTVVTRIADQCSAPFAFEGRPVAIAASAGIAVFPDDGETLELLLEASDEAMYRMKQSRSGRRI